MNEYNVQFYCGQIKFVKDFFKEYKDDQVQTTLKQVGKIKAVFQVTSSLSPEDTVRHLKNIFKESRYGSALHFNVQVIE
ncbi:hypothetical protein ACQKP0_04125 [Heyndrickxia sp. NPDC080065]|uniref:hypothetical protein n=1 Tax=Heyndrickxia sp. NPDC080065 TaxID=3390568 RepID=UPI003CFF8269